MELEKPIDDSLVNTALEVYDFFSPPRIVFGWGRRTEIGGLAASLGKRAFVVAGSQTLERQGVLAAIFRRLEEQGVQALQVALVRSEPEVADVDRLQEKLIELHAGHGDLLIGIGGGSAIDLAKAGAALATNRDGTSVGDYLEGVGRGLKILHEPLPMIAIPSTSGTGSEATKNAVISSYRPPFKKSLRADTMVPRIVLIDPELSVSVPPDITAQTGMDAITQLIESFISRRAKPIPRALSIQGLQMAIPALPVSVRDGSNRPAREAMAHAALLSGMALANSGLGMAHGIAAALGAECKVRHGLACAVMLPVALRTNLEVCQAELALLERSLTAAPSPDTCSVTRTAKTADAEAAEAFVCRIESLTCSLKIPKTLGELGVQKSQIPALVSASRGNSMAGNPRDISDDELSTILENLL